MEKEKEKIIERSLIYKQLQRFERKSDEDDKHFEMKKNKESNRENAMHFCSNNICMELQSRTIVCYSCEQCEKLRLEMVLCVLPLSFPLSKMCIG